MDLRGLIAGAFVIWLPGQASTEGVIQGDAGAPAPLSLQALYDGRLWFDLRDRTREGDAPLFFRAAAALAFEAPGAEALMQAVVDRDAAHRSEARSRLIDAYFRSGRYVEASDEAGRVLQETPGAADVRNVQAIFKQLKRYGDQTVVRYRASRLPMTVIDTSFFLPVSINGVRARYGFDGGASMSFISRSEAKRLGLTVTRTGGRMGTITDQSLRVEVASARRLRIGGVELRNVGFYVFPDEQPPFPDLPRGSKGLLGLPVLRALKTVSWSAASRTFRIGPEQHGGDTSPLAFDGSAMAVQARFKDRPITFAFDTGAQKTVLYPKFADLAPEAMTGARVTTHTLTGVGGASSLAARALAPVHFRLGGRTVTLRNATVLDGRSGVASTYYVGNLGMDVLDEARTTTIDFPRMTLSLR